jgi:hypothetical protein
MIKFLGLCLFLIGCASSELPEEQNPEFSAKYNICKKGCDHLSTLKEFDGTKGCKESKPVGEVSCAKFCTKKLIDGNKILDPKCWTTLQSCSDFEEVCNLGELYP